MSLKYLSVYADDDIIDIEMECTKAIIFKDGSAVVKASIPRATLAHIAANIRHESFVYEPTTDMGG